MADYDNMADDLYQDEDRKRRPEPVALPGLLGSPAAALAAAMPGQIPSVAPPSTYNPVSPPQPGPSTAALMASRPPELHGWRKGLDIAGQILAPRIESRIPGSTGNYYGVQLPRMERAAAEEQSAYGTPFQQQEFGLRQQEAQNRSELEDAQAAAARAKAALEAQPKKLESLNQVEAQLYGKMVAGGTPPLDALKQINSARPDTAAAADTRQQAQFTHEDRARAEQFAEQEKLRNMEIFAQNARRGKTPAVENVPPQLVPVAIADYTKAGQSYADAAQQADNMRDFIETARKGNTLANAYSPTEGVLQINTSAGVKRVNMAEIKSYGAQGSLVQRLEGALGGLATGKKIPDSILNDMAEIHGQIANNAKTKYHRSVDVINNSYGSQFTPIEFQGAQQGQVPGQNPAPGAGAPAAGASPAGPWMIRARDPQGKLHQAPAGTPLPKGWQPE